MKVAVDEARAPFQRGQLSPMALHALCGAYVRYLARGADMKVETVLDRYYTETGGRRAKDDYAAFRKWGCSKVYVMDQLRLPPFGPQEETW